MTGKSCFQNLEETGERPRRERLKQNSDHERDEGRYDDPQRLSDPVGELVNAPLDPNKSSVDVRLLSFQMHNPRFNVGYA